MKYRKKPVVIDAYRWMPEQPVSVAGYVPDWIVTRNYDIDGNALLIKTLEGTMRAEPGDSIIKGVKGELYPCKPDIFEATYEPVS